MQLNQPAGFAGAAPLRKLKRKASLALAAVVALRHAEARQQASRDLRGLPVADPGWEAVINAGLEWLGAAQDHSLSGDGGVPRHYSLIDGWSTSYPETTGYIIPTWVACAGRFGRPDLLERARRALDWLEVIQLVGGGFQGGVIGSTPVVPVVFNTGQIMLGLAAGVAQFGRYQEALARAAEWLISVQDADGSWSGPARPFAAPGATTFETHAAWGLLEASSVCHNQEWGEAGLANVRWALGLQQPNGWFAHCSLGTGDAPLTHTIGYVLRGVVEAWRFSQEKMFLEAAKKTADAVLRAMRPDGFVSGRFGSGWEAEANWACLTGTSQIAHCWFQLFQATGDSRYLLAGQTANRYVRRTVRTSGADGVRGGVQGSFPVWAEYSPFQFPNWAAKFTIDANLMEDLAAERVTESSGSGASVQR